MIFDLDFAGTAAAAAAAALPRTRKTQFLTFLFFRSSEQIDLNVTRLETTDGRHFVLGQLDDDDPTLRRVAARQEGDHAAHRPVGVAGRRRRRRRRCRRPVEPAKAKTATSKLFSEAF